MDRYRNPYRATAGATPPFLAGRDQLLSDFNVTLRLALDRRPSKSLMPIGLRGVGKTVLLNRFAEDARKLNYEICSIEAPETGTFALLLATQLRKALLELDTSAQMKNRASQILNRALGVLRSFVLTLPMDPGWR